MELLLENDSDDLECLKDSLDSAKDAIEELQDQITEMMCNKKFIAIKQENSIRQ